MCSTSRKRGRFENIRRDLKKSQTLQTPDRNLLLTVALTDTTAQGQKAGGSDVA